MYLVLSLAYIELISLYPLLILMLDITKAFDTVKKRCDLIKILTEVLGEDQIHLSKIFLKDVSLIVRIGKETYKEIITIFLVPQGDCLSLLLLIIYLTNAMQEKNICNRRRT